MKQHLHVRFILGFLFIGIAGFFFITFAGSFMIERYLESTTSASLYQEANNIASNESVITNMESGEFSHMRANLSAISQYQNTIIWLINTKGEIILSTRLDIGADSPVVIDGFDPDSWGPHDYHVGNFYGRFARNYLSVLTPIKKGDTVLGYVSIHYLMSSLYQRRGSSLLIVQFLFLSIYVLTLLLLIIYQVYVHRPLEQITKGAAEYAKGNLAYRIPVNSDDEMGYLANTLNYMSEELNKNEEYQRDFISNVSHDFRSPLTSIKGYVEAMLDGTIPPEAQEKYLRIIDFEAKRLEKLTKNLLELSELDSRKRRLNIQRFDFNDIARTASAAFEGICNERHIRLELLFSSEKLYVNADMEQIQQVLYNLLDNAIKFSSDFASVILETSEKNDLVFVSVKDNGRGIPKDSLSKIWTRFYKTDASRGRDRKGTGLGLSIVKEILKAHGQNIDVISTEGVGTEFIFSLEKAR